MDKVKTFDKSVGGRDIEQFVAKWLDAREKIKWIRQRVRELEQPLNRLECVMHNAAIGASKVLNNHGMTCIACPIKGIVALARHDETIELVISTQNSPTPTESEGS